MIPEEDPDLLLFNDDDEAMDMMDLKYDLYQENEILRKPSIKVKRPKKKSRKITVVKMPDEKKAGNENNNDAFDDYDDPFTMKMKEIGIDWNKL